MRRGGSVERPAMSQPCGVPRDSRPSGRGAFAGRYRDSEDAKLLVGLFCRKDVSVSSEPKLFKIDPASRQSTAMSEVDFTDLGLQERRDIQEWIASNPSILGQDLLIVSKEFSGFDRTNERLDLLAVDIDGKLVVVELKRDDSGVDVHWQAIKYASYLYRVSGTRIVEMLASYGGIPESDARRKLVQHLGSDDDLNALNNDQRIILASHRFAPEVTSAALWLNEKSTAGHCCPTNFKRIGGGFEGAGWAGAVAGADRGVVGARRD